ncbi:MAG: homoserine kinase [Candidatus Kryptoniota bacterium]
MRVLLAPHHALTQIKQHKGAFKLTIEFRRVVVPASTSNLGPGFDTLGLAVNKYLTIEVEKSTSFSIEISGEGADKIPTDERNLTLTALKRILGELPKVRMKILNDIPACGGLGASGAAIVGGLLLGNEIAGKKFCDDDIYNAAVKIEGHPDNVSAALYGGLVVNARLDEGKYSRIRIPVDAKLKLVAVLPDTRIETQTARKILPDSVTLSDAVSNVQHSSLLVAAFASGDYEMIRYAVLDKLHEKYRKKLIPHYDIFSEAAVKNGALAFTVSGAGSSCIAFCLNRYKMVQETFDNLIDEMKLNWRTDVLEPINNGAEIFTD